MERILLWERDIPQFDEKIGQAAPSLTPFLLEDGKKHGAVIVFPGGGYTMKAAHEGAPVAERLNEMGLHAFVLDYRVAPYRFPVPLLDAQRAIRLVRSRAAAWNILPDKVAVLGFSAGGHLAGMCGTHFDAGDPAAADPVERQSCRPDAFAPCYGVLNLNHTRRADLFSTMIGKGDPDLATVRSISPAYAVTKETPPCFLWHTAADSVVPVENSLDFAQRCADMGVPVSLHVYPFGRHGIGLGDEAEAPGAGTWSALLDKFLHQIGF